VKYFLFIALLGQAIICVAQVNDTARPVIAILEDYADTISVEPYRLRTIYEPRIRGAFFKDKTGWATMCNNGAFSKMEECPAESTRLFSTLFAFNGEYRYEIKTTGLLKREHCCLDVGWLETSDIGHVRQNGDRLLKYSGWNYDPVLKPQILTNRPERVSDPETWKEIARQETLKPKTWKLLASMVNEMKLCVAAKSDKRGVVTFPWKNTYLEFQHRFANQNNQVLLQARLSQAYFRDCKRQGGDTGEIPAMWPEFWLTQSRGQDSVIHLFKNEIGFGKLELLEFGDFDGDGKSEGLFFLAGYNLDGYVLFHEGMTKQARYFWGYH
jgi:hypothetical protein